MHPPRTFVDSHTSTHGACGALACGIGTSEVGHGVLLAESDAVDASETSHPARVETI
jgi:homoaconitase/3-isopropylmalate dehydratase large subunit